MFDSLITALQSSATANIIEIDNVEYTDRQVFFPKQRTIAPIEVNTLQSIVDYLFADNVEPLYLRESALVGAILIESPNCVKIVSTANFVTGNRDTIMTCTTTTQQFSFGKYTPSEEFAIALASQFVRSADENGDLSKDDNLSKLISVVGNLTTGTLKTSTDDGISQTVAVKASVSRADSIQISPRITLAPFRTFPEVEQPKSDFLFRLKQDSSGSPSCALFEADGGAWKVEAKANIKAWLDSKLGDAGILILS
jgi:hypothetical protein